MKYAKTAVSPSIVSPPSKIFKICNKTEAGYQESIPLHKDLLQ
jgi:hypothetical protein